MNNAVALINFLVQKIQPDTLSQNYIDQAEQYEKLSKEKQSISALNMYLLGEQILIKQQQVNPEDKLTFRKSLITQFEHLDEETPFRIASESIKDQEFSLSLIFIETLIKKAKAGNKIENSELLQSLIEEFQKTETKSKADSSTLIQLCRKIFENISNQIGKEPTIRIYLDTYYELSDRYRLLEGFSFLINLMPQDDIKIDQLEILNKIQIQSLLLEKIESLEKTNERLSHEISEKLKIEEELKESESLLNKIIESALDSMVLLNENGEIDYWSPQSEKLTGRLKSDIIGKKFSDELLSSDYKSAFESEIYDFINQLNPIEEKKRFESRIRCDDGHQIDVEISMTSVKLKDRYIISSFIRDISQRKEYEREIIDARDKAEEASAAKLTFLSMMSHEIRTPLNAVIGTSQLLLAENPRKDQLENLNILKFSAENLLSIINDILDFNKAEEGKMVLESQPFNMEMLCNNIVNSFIPMSKEKGITIKFENKLKRINLVTGDETRLSQVLINLFGNAVKFTSSGSVILSAELINLNDRIGEVRFEVIDTGIGIPKEKIASIFDRFTQVHEPNKKEKYGGTGLGLPIAKNIVKLMGGDLSISSVPGLGSTFYFSIRLPIPYKEGLSKKDSAKEEFGIIFNKNILIVEDHKINQIVASKFLKKYECNIDIAENGEEAVNIIRDQSKKYDLILMDLEMPVMNGYEAAIEIRKIENKTEQTPIVALSANALLDVSKKVQEAGMNGYISKPFEAQHFYAQIADNIKE